MSSQKLSYMSHPLLCFLYVQVSHLSTAKQCTHVSYLLRILFLVSLLCKFIVLNMSAYSLCILPTYTHTHAHAYTHASMHTRMHAHTPYTHTHTVMSPQLGDTFGINDEYGVYANTFPPVNPHSHPDPHSHLIPHSHPNPTHAKCLPEDSISLCGVAREREAGGFEKEGDEHLELARRHTLCADTDGAVRAKGEELLM